MKRKQLSLLLAAATLSIAVSAPAIAAEPDDATDNVVVEAVDSEADDTSGEAAGAEATDESEAGETETKSDFVEGSAVLNDYEYEKGELTETGWNNTFLNMTYVPGKDISMGIAENDQLATYHERNGEDKQVAVNEMVAVDSKEGYVQLMVEVNPNSESAEDILGRFCENEGLTLVSDQNEMEIAGKNFLTCTGVVDKDRFLIGVSVDEDNFAIALKVKYANTVARRALLDGFDVIEETGDETAAEASSTELAAAEEAEAETTEAAAEAETDEGLSMPSEFEDGEFFEADETEASVIE